MVKQFYSIQTWLEKQNFFILNKITYRLLLFIIRIAVPFYYKFRPSKKSGICVNNNRRKIIVTLTSFPPRMNNLWMVLESLLRQTHQPDKIILWLATSQFPSITDVNQKVREMQSRGLEIRFCEDYKSHKKYYHTMKEYNNDLIITVDDDIFYPENMIETLLKGHKNYPDCIVCYRAHKITLTNGKVNNYVEWDYASRNILGPDPLLIATNGGGALYPPNSLDKEVFNIDAIQKLCPNADDIWLKCMGLLAGTNTVKVHEVYSEMFTTFGSAENGLAKNNVVKGYNDIQFENVVSNYPIEFNS
jgi:hypothetical protein